MNVRMNGGPNAERERKRAAEDYSECTAPTGLLADRHWSVRGVVGFGGDVCG